VNFETIFNDLISDTLAKSLPGFRPELALCGTIVLMLLVRVFNWGRREDAFFIALAGSAIALYFAAPWKHLADGAALRSQETFTGLLVYDSLTVYFRALLLLFALLFVLFTRISGIPDKEDGPDFYTLVLGATLGMCLMASSNHLLMIFLGIEMASVPSYALAGMLKGRRQSSEAALKYAVYGAGAAGVMLYGISLLAGVLGTCHLPTIASQLAELIQSGQGTDRYVVLSLAALMIGAGLAFKLSAVPFHFWCPDVFEGASAEVNAFLSVSSKAAALALLVRVVMGVSHVDAPAAQPSSEPAVAAATAPVIPVSAKLQDPQPAAAPAEPPATQVPIASATATLAPVRQFLTWLLVLISAVTCTFGNLAAYGQSNIKRLLAYSTIAHAGYMMMPVAAAVGLMGEDLGRAERAVTALCFYAGTYLFMNLGAFAIVAFLRNELRTEEIDGYAGLIRRSPGIALCFSAILLSLLGIPPLVGMWAKVTIFAAMWDARLWLLLAVAGLNSVISLFYYLRVVKVMILEPAPEGEEAGVPIFSLSGLYTLLVTLPVLVLFVWWDPLYVWAREAARGLL
jgi:NADH-quinone oxidoreductase subunit N